jgi:hypothetical protein
MAKSWIKPELVILAKSNPEEAVLTVCKASPSAGMGPLLNVNNCQQVIFPTPCVAPCDTVSAT